MIELSPEEYERELTYDEAILYCFSLNIDGKTGWRMPTIDELQANFNVREFWHTYQGNSMPVEFKKWKLWIRPVRDLT